MMMKRYKKKHPYMGLAFFSLAAAGMINLVHRAKDFMTDKITCIGGFIKKKTED